MKNVVVAGVGMTRFGMFPELSTGDLALEAVSIALTDAGCSADDIQAVLYSNAADGAMSQQHSVRGEVALQRSGLLGQSIINVENACASGSSAFRLACLEVASGEREVVLAVGVEKMSYPDKRAMLRTLNSGTDIAALPELRERLGGDPDRSIFMDIYAGLARSRMESSDVTLRDFAAVVEKSRLAGSLNPNAQFRTPVSSDAALAARVIADPLTLPMCSPIADGAAALVVTSADYAQRRGITPVFVRASVLLSGLGEAQGEVSAARAARQAYETAGVGPEDVHVAEVHDATASAEIGLYEDLGFCAPGDGGRLIREGATGINGRIAVNSSGGLLSRGHPIGATGCAQLVELTEQLRGCAAQRQREGARVALAENGGGWLGRDAAVAAVTILSN
jgi:acetyl-CoA acyltransferase